MYQGDFVNGSRVYMMQCNTCHSLEQSSQSKQTSGPALGLIFGRRVASDKYFKSYTDSAISSRIIWTERNLFKFTEDPQKYIPGTLCQIKNGGIKNEEDRADLAKYLKLFTKTLYQNLRVKAVNLYGKEYVDNYILTQKQISEKQFNAVYDKQQ